MTDTGIMILIGVAVLTALVIGYFIGKKISSYQINKLWEEKLPDIRKDAINRSRANLGGKFTESLSPYFPDFPFSPTEMRWMGGAPVDYIAFEGMDKDIITNIVFVEIKSGKSQLSNREKQIKELIEQKKVSWHMYRVPENITQVRE